MIERVIDISDEGASLSVNLERLVIKRGEEKTTIPLAEVAVLIVSNPAVWYTQAVLTGICSNSGMFILCNEKRMPIGMLLPLEQNYIQGERFALQASVPLPTNKKLWKQIIKAKVNHQGKLLSETYGEDRGLYELAKRVRSGDAGNVEAQASRRYWQALFGEGFRRDPDLEGVNSLLNYGYAVLRAGVARAICGAGLHPSLGLHHHNRYNPFCLADDLMEPFRPIVDKVVFNISKKDGDNTELTREAKQKLIKAITEREFELEGEKRNLFSTLSRVAISLLSVYTGSAKKLSLPEF